MNANLNEQLAAIVDSIVRPIWATRSRKAIMREELLAHLSAVFDEEFTRLGSEQQALAAASERFGVAVDIERQLQTSVPFYREWMAPFLKENEMARWLWLLALAAISLGIAILLPAMAKVRNEHVAELYPFVLGGLITLAGVAAVGYGIVRRFTRTS